MKEYIHEKIKYKDLVREIEQLYVEIGKTEMDLRHINNPNISKRVVSSRVKWYEQNPDIGSAALNRCAQCLEMRKKYPEILRNYGCICKEDCNITEGNIICVCQPEKLAIIRW